MPPRRHGAWCAVAYPAAPAEIVVYSYDVVVDGVRTNAAAMTCEGLEGGTAWGLGNWVQGRRVPIIVAKTAHAAKLLQPGVRNPFARTHHLVVDCRIQVGASTMWILGRADDERGRLVCGVSDASPQGVVAIIRLLIGARPSPDASTYPF
jgi:hypothetical protein